MIQYLNCTSNNECTHDGPPVSFEFSFWFYLIICCLSLCGITLNSISVFIFSYSSDMKNKFFQLLKVFSISCLVVSFNELFISGFYISLYRTKIRYNLNGRMLDTSSIGVFIFTYIYIGIRQIFSLYGGVLDLVIINERIQLYNPKWKFLAKKTAFQLAFYVLIFCVAINIPSIISKDIYSFNLELVEFNKTITMFDYEPRKFNNQIVFDWILATFIFIRDIIALALDITFTILLISALVNYKKQKMAVVRSTGTNKVIYKKEDIDAVRTALFLVFLSAFAHIINFSIHIIYRLDTTPNKFIYVLVGMTGNFLITTRYSFNFFIFLKLNKIFKNNFLRNFCCRRV